jgi:transcriptional regulator with XRE-family HTH domain
MMAEKFSDVDYAHDFLMHLVDEEELSVEEALIQLAKRMGEKEFAALVKISKQKVNDIVKGRRKLTLNMLNQLLEPLGFVLHIGLKEA